MFTFLALKKSLFSTSVGPITFTVNKHPHCFAQFRRWTTQLSNATQLERVAMCTKKLMKACP